MPKKDGSPTKDELPGGRASSAPINAVPQADMTNWRRQMMESKLKFDDVQKQIFLDKLLETGKPGLSAAHAGVCQTTVARHRKEDPDFGEAYTRTLKLHAEDIVQRLETAAMEGFENDVYDKDGVKIGIKTTFETQLRVAMLKRFDPEYKDRQEIEHKGGGVMVAPAAMTPEQWLAQQQAANEARQAPDGAIPED